ncbi:MAG: hypothetical protein HKM02_09645 [Pseudomonadales bacterium]|nr:hypothetical protein [Pseudomonadales bacterium]
MVLNLTWWQDPQASMPQRELADFSIFLAHDRDELQQHAQSCDLVVIEASHGSEGPLDTEYLQSLPCPVVLLASDNDPDYRIIALNEGYADMICSQVSIVNLELRLHQLVDHDIANKQLQSMAATAQDVAMQAMTMSSDIGNNLQFLLDVAQCTNLDELGMRLFHSLNDYGLQASLQLRGRYEIKNMEANGMARELESQLLSEMHESGRYVDFGKRLIMNYGRVSLLVRNMPTDHEIRHGQLRDSMFSLLQGADSRIQSIDMNTQIQESLENQHRLTQRLQVVAQNIEESNAHIIHQCAAVFDAMNFEMEEALAILGMNETQEHSILTMLKKGQNQINQQVNVSAGIAQTFQRLLKHLSEN